MVRLPSTRVKRLEQVVAFMLGIPLKRSLGSKGRDRKEAYSRIRCGQEKERNQPPSYT
jgi:hypothetical protein